MAAARGKAAAADLPAARREAVPAAFVAAAIQSLPRDIASFTGRQAELAQLTGILHAAAEGAGVVRIHAVDGMAGIGKTSFAVHVAHRLAALEDAAVITLDPLPSAEAATLLTRIAARPGISAGDPAVDQITRLCGCLPLAIGMLASHLRHHPAWDCADLAAELAAARDRLALMRTENLSVAAAFGLSYQDLTPGPQRLFRRLGLVPGPSFDAYTAAALNGTSLGQTRRHLGDLYDQKPVPSTSSA